MCEHLHENNGKCCGECDKDKCTKTECPYGETGQCTYWDESCPMEFPEYCDAEELQ